MSSSWCVTAACARPQTVPHALEPAAAVSNSISGGHIRDVAGGKFAGGAAILFPVRPLAGRRARLSCRAGRHGRRLAPVRMAPEEEKMTRRSPLDFPIEWERPKPGRRPDIFPKFSPMKTPLPPPLPADPDPEEDEEEEEKKEEEEDPEKEEDPENPDQST